MSFSELRMTVWRMRSPSKICDQHISNGVEYDPIVTCASAGAREKLSPITLLLICSEASKHADTCLEGFVLLFIPSQRVTVHDVGKLY